MEDGSRKARTSNRIVKSYLLYHWAINPVTLLSELDSNKHRTLPKNVDLPISLSLMLSTSSHFYTYTATIFAQSRNRTKIYYLQDSRTNRCTNWAIGYLMICTGLEPVLPQWKSGVLTSCTSKSLPLPEFWGFDTSTERGRRHLNQFIIASK